MQAPHTILITGADELIRQEKARELAQKAMSLAQIETSPDFLLLGADAETSIGIEKTKELRAWVATKPLASKKVVYIHNAEKLTLEAQNALLKLLEEPPEDTLFILSCYRESALLPTVISRCAIVNLPPSLPQLENITQSALVELLKGTLADRLDWCHDNQKLIKNDLQILKILREWLVVTRDLIFAKSSIPATFWHIPQARITTDIAAWFDLSEWLLIAQVIEQTSTEIEQSAVDRRLLLENMLLNFPTLTNI